MFLDKFITNKNTKQLIINIFTLMVLQGANYILPLITFPYLIRTLGLETYGLLAFASATIAYFALFTDYGFELSATRQLAVCREDMKQVNRLFSSVLIIKVIIMLFSFMLLLLLVNGISKFRQHQLLYIITFGSVIGQMLFSKWFFQGMEKMKYLHMILVGKIFYALGIFLFIHSSKDYLLVSTMSTLIDIVIGCIGFTVVTKRFGVEILLPPKHYIIYQLKEGWYIFSSLLAISLYTISTTFVLGLFTNNIVVGQFAAADKIIKACTSLQHPFSQALYPFISKEIARDRLRGVARAIKYTNWLALVIGFCSVLVMIFSPQIVRIIVGHDDAMIVLLIRIMIFIPVLVTLSHTYAIKLMLNLGMEKAYNRVYFSVAFSGSVLGVILISSYQAIGLSISIVIIEAAVTLSTYLCLKYALKSFPRGEGGCFNG